MISDADCKSYKVRIIAVNRHRHIDSSRHLSLLSREIWSRLHARISAVLLEVDNGLRIKLQKDGSIVLLEEIFRSDGDGLNTLNIRSNLGIWLSILKPI